MMPKRTQPRDILPRLLAVALVGSSLAMHPAVFVDPSSLLCQSAQLVDIEQIFPTLATDGYAGAATKRLQGLQGFKERQRAELRSGLRVVAANRPYTIFGKTYTPTVDSQSTMQCGVGSWYGKEFHGRKTSSGEPYNMYDLTAAHPTLPIPSYARVTDIDSGRKVIVRINDRGPFHKGRIIDLSYAAARKLGYLSKGTSELKVEALSPEESERSLAAQQKHAKRGQKNADRKAADAAMAEVARADAGVDTIGECRG